MRNEKNNSNPSTWQGPHIAVGCSRSSCLAAPAALAALTAWAAGCPAPLASGGGRVVSRASQ